VKSSTSEVGDDLPTLASWERDLVEISGCSGGQLHHSGSPVSEIGGGSARLREPGRLTPNTWAPPALPLLGQGTALRGRGRLEFEQWLLQWRLARQTRDS